jgi:hypothetical protein
MCGGFEGGELDQVHAICSEGVRYFRFTGHNAVYRSQYCETSQMPTWDNDHHVNKSGVIRPSGSSVDANGNTLYIASCALPPAGLALEEMEKRAEWRIIKPSQRK